MATSKSTTTRKPSTTRAASSTSTSRSDTNPGATTEATTPETGATGATGETSGEASGSTGQEPTPAAATAGGNDTPASGPAAELKNRMRTTQHITDPRPDDLTDEQRVNLVGAPAGSLPGPRTLPSATSPTRTTEEYVLAESEGHVAFVPKRQNQSATKRVWVKGQKVRKDVHEALSAFVAPTPRDARVLSDEEFAQVAPHL